MLYGNYKKLHDLLKRKVPQNRLLHDDLSLLVFGIDASFYRLMPKLIVKANTEEEVVTVLRYCSDLKLPITFRAAGTSLSGQAISDSVLLVLDHGWKDCQITNKADKIRLQPGVVGSQANQTLLPYGKKIGPDPASIDAAMIGGIAANNASGMCCGTAQNSYRTLAGMKIIFVDGTLLDTNDPRSVRSFKASHRDILEKIHMLHDRVMSDTRLAERIRQKFKMKNTTGYSLNALVDYDDPVEIIQHLMIGSEGTLGFIAEITYHTVPEYKHKATSLMIFPDIENACKAVAVLKQCPVDAVELMDRASLRSVESKEGMPPFLLSLDERSAALLVETRAPGSEPLMTQIDEIKDSLVAIPTVFPIEFTTISAEFEKLWNIRKGLFPSVGAIRETGTAVIIEDVAFPVPRLAEATLELQDLFRKYEYHEAIIFGHALEGNLHFVFKQNFNLPEEVERYRKFIDDVTQMVVKKYDGALKAEHGTGRNMAPFVEMEWGREAYELMREIKNIFDPDRLLNPGVVLNDDPQAHLKDLKPMPAAHELIDKCIECGFCEVNCVANHLTLSPRHRIVAFREISRLKTTGAEQHRLAQLQDAYRYQGDQTCATDGLCALACPVDIDTGQLIKALRHDELSSRAKRIAQRIADNMDKVTAAARFGLNTVHIFHTVLGTNIMRGLAQSMRTMSFNKLAKWTPLMPKGSKMIYAPAIHESSAPKVVYFPSCITRSMGIARDYNEKIDLPAKIQSLLQKAGYDIIYPENMNGLCCGMAFASKGFKEIGDQKAQELNEALLRASRQGELPLLCDMSPCHYRMKETLDTGLKLYEPIEFTLEYLVDRLKIEKQPLTIAIHTVCSAKKMSLEDKFLRLAEMCADKVIVADTNCCGFAGDRGFTFPELNVHGLRKLSEQIPEDCTLGYSTSRTCEIGLSEHSGISFKSVLYLVDQCSTHF